MCFKHKLNPILLGIMVSLGSCSLPLLANEMEDELEMGNMSLSDLMNIEIVSATRSESKLSESPVPISVITAQEIADSGLDNIPDVLARLPEIDVLHIGRSQTEVSIRGKGINFNRRLLVLIDGRTEYNDLFGVTLWHALPISMDDIKRIEVVRGPSSALFGANAYSGVINIISKQAGDENAAQARVQIGENGAEYSSFYVNAKGNNSSFKASYSRQSVDSVQTDVPFAGFNRIPSTVNFSPDASSLEGMERFNASVIYHGFEDWNFHINAGASDGSMELFQQPGLPREKWEVEGQNVHGLLNYTFGELTSMQFNIYKNNFKYYTALVPLRSAQEALTNTDNGFFYPVRDHNALFSGEVDTFDYSLQFVGKAFEDKVAWVAGVERREVENIGGIVQDSKRDINSIFANFTLRFGEGWIGGLGLRKDDDSIIGGDIGYNASLQYALNETDSLRVTARKAFRAPSLFELFSSVDLPVPNQNQQVNFRGNTNLEVETIESVDITYTAQFSDRVQATVEVFHETYGQIIGNPDSGILDEVEITAEGLFISTTSFQNLADASSDGLQTSLVWLAMDNLKVYANYRYDNPKDLNSVAGETFFTPEHTVKFGANWKIGESFVVDMSFQSIGKTDSDEFVRGDVSPDGTNFTKDNQESYNTLNFALHYRPKWQKGLDLYVVIDNALDDNHVEYYEYDQILNGVGEMSGRTIWGGFSWKF
jgi:iron complex outermembrane receptor protein